MEARPIKSVRIQPSNICVLHRILFILFCSTPPWGNSNSSAPHQPSMPSLSVTPFLYPSRSVPSCSALPRGRFRLQYASSILGASTLLYWDRTSSNVSIPNQIFTLLYRSTVPWWYLNLMKAFIIPICIPHKQFYNSVYYIESLTILWMLNHNCWIPTIHWKKFFR